MIFLITASVKTTKMKVMGALCVILAVIIALILFFFGGNGPEPSEEAVSRHVTDNSSRRDFIASMGWKTAEEPSSVVEVQLPAEFDEVLTKYNELQLASGMDLTPYLGKTVTKYSYKVENFPGSGEVYATLYVYDGTVIAADIASHTDSWQRSIDGK
ncbi:MAG: DUF4830 domain-containing protein [Oscillospiraceae bacterium]